MKLSLFIRLLASLSLLTWMTVPVLSEEAAVLLSPPGLRPVRDPSTIIPANYQYPNSTLTLPDYREPSGRVKKGWATQVIKTRRFFSNRSAHVYFRASDLAHSTVFKTPGPLKEMRIWPYGTHMVIEIYEGDGSTIEGSKPIETAVMVKLEVHSPPSPASFYRMDWAYAKFSAKGDPTIHPDEVKECHRCHSIAFHLTGDLIFTKFP